MTQKLREYFNEGFKRVDGWVAESVFPVLTILNDAAVRHHIKGGCCEIGVHHGRFYLALLALADDGAKSLAIDLFGQQALNIDRSGRGDKEQFLLNITKWATPGAVSEILEIDSLALSVHDIVKLQQQFGRFKVFSVDGGHTRDHALNDMLVAQELTLNGGLIIVDDFFHPDWPGVTEGVSRYFGMSNAKFAPLCIAGGKLFLTSISYHQSHLSELHSRLIQNHPKSPIKSVTIHGWQAFSFRLAPGEPVMGV